MNQAGPAPASSAPISGISFWMRRALRLRLGALTLRLSLKAASNDARPCFWCRLTALLNQDSQCYWLSALLVGGWAIRLTSVAHVTIWPQEDWLGTRRTERRVKGWTGAFRRATSRRHSYAPGLPPTLTLKP